MDLDLKGKSLIVTGGGSNIGQSVQRKWTSLVADLVGPANSDAPVIAAPAGIGHLVL